MGSTTFSHPLNLCLDVFDDVEYRQQRHSSISVLLATFLAVSDRVYPYVD